MRTLVNTTKKKGNDGLVFKWELNQVKLMREKDKMLLLSLEREIRITTGRC